MKNFNFKMRSFYLSLKIGVVFSVLLFCATAEIFAAFSPMGVPDSSSIRRDLVETWFEAPLDILRDTDSKKYTVRGTEFEVRREENGEAFLVVVAPLSKNKLVTYDNNSKLVEKYENMYLADSPGGWVLMRDKKNGQPICMRYYFSSDSNVFVEIVPDAANPAKSYANFFVYDFYAAHNVSLRLPFSNFYAISLAELVKLTARTLPWNYADIHTGIYHSVQQMVGMINAALPELEYAENAMLDERENQINILDGRPYRPKMITKNVGNTTGEKIYLSSGGFVKWICDGLVKPIAGGGLFREPLLMETATPRTVSYQGVLSQKNSLSFALDWTRNLASAVRSIDSAKDLRYPDSGVDVTIEPFSARKAGDSFTKFSGYTPNVGYSIKELRALLYVLAVTDPGAMFLGALRQTDGNAMAEVLAQDGTKEMVKRPEVHTFSQCVAFFPYFEKNGRFRCRVYADCTEIDLDVFAEEYNNEFIHLTKVNTSDFFYPTRINVEETIAELDEEF